MKSYDHLSIFLQGAENCAPGKWNTNKNALCIFDENGNRVIWTNHQNVTAFIIAAHEDLPSLLADLKEANNEIIRLRDKLSQIDKLTDSLYGAGGEYADKIAEKIWEICK